MAVGLRLPKPWCPFRQKSKQAKSPSQAEQVLIGCRIDLSSQYTFALTGHTQKVTWVFSNPNTYLTQKEMKALAHLAHIQTNLPGFYRRQKDHHIISTTAHLLFIAKQGCSWSQFDAMGILKICLFSTAGRSRTVMHRRLGEVHPLRHLASTEGRHFVQITVEKYLLQATNSLIPNLFHW